MRNLLVCLLVLFCLGGVSFGEDFYLNATEGKTIKSALGLLSGGDTLYLEGVFYCGLSPRELQYKDTVTIDGQGKTLLFSYSGTYDSESKEITYKDLGENTITEKFNPAKHRWLANWNNLTVTDSHNITVKNLDVWGGCMAAFELNNSNAVIGLVNLTFYNCKFLYGGSRGMFTGGHWANGISLIRCTIGEAMYGDVTHSVYFSGGHWSGSVGYGGWRNIRLHRCTFRYSGGRHLVQFNGVFTGVTITGCIFYHGQLSGLSLIGVQDANIQHNIFYGSNRQCIVGYADGQDDKLELTPGHWVYVWDHVELIDEWMQYHQPNRNHLIQNNTLFVGHKQWHKNQWHNDKPDNQPAILYNNPIFEVMEQKCKEIMAESAANNQAYWDGLITKEEQQVVWLKLQGELKEMRERQERYRNKNYLIRKNILNGTNAGQIVFYHLQEAQAATVCGNLFQHGKTANDLAPGGGISVAGEWYNIRDLQDNYHGQVFNNYFETAMPFEQWPEYPDAIDTTEFPEYFFGEQHKSEADLICEKAAALGIGATR